VILPLHRWHANDGDEQRPSENMSRRSEPSQPVYLFLLTLLWVANDTMCDMVHVDACTTWTQGGDMGPPLTW
jgi:predicted amidohydrolase YtcJ